jgi:hypothetical protein
VGAAFDAVAAESRISARRPFNISALSIRSDYQETGLTGFSSARSTVERQVSDRIFRTIGGFSRWRLTSI